MTCCVASLKFVTYAARSNRRSFDSVCHKSTANYAQDDNVYANFRDRTLAGVARAADCEHGDVIFLAEGLRGGGDGVGGLRADIAGCVEAEKLA